MSLAEHRAGVDSLHSKMREFFREYDRRLISSWTNPGFKIVNRFPHQERIDALNAFYRSLEKSPILHYREAFEPWQKIFPEVRKYIKP